MILPYLLPVVLGRVGSLPFADAVRGAEVVLQGRVTKVFVVGGHRFAELQAEKVLKGERAKTVRFLAEPVWACDSSTAHEGERGVFLLSSLSRNAWIDREPTRSSAIRQAKAQGPVFALLGAGAGRIVLGEKAWGVSKYGNRWYFGRLVMPSAVPPHFDAQNRPYYTEDRIVYAAERCLTNG